MASKPNIERLHELFRLDPERGLLIRKISVSSRAQSGEIAGSLHKASGYRFVNVDSVKYREHVLIWYMLYGEWLPRQIDHEDRDRGNNRPLNLRRATESQQRQNMAIRCDNTTGARGVHFQAGAFVARVQINGEERYLGRFKRFEDAAFATRQARLQYYGEFAPSYDHEVR